MAGKGKDEGKVVRPPLAPIIMHSCLMYALHAAGCVVAMEVSEPVYRAALNAWPYSHHAFYVVGSMVVHNSMYWGVNTFFYLCDTFGWMQDRKMDRLDRHKVKPGTLQVLMKEALIDQFVSMPLSIGAVWYLARYMGMGVDTPKPSPLETFLVVVAGQFILEFTFYWAHRLLHRKDLYWIHKKHHEFKGTIGFAAEYAHPIEKVLANNIPTILPAILFGMHAHLWWVWVAWRLWQTFEAHSGYIFPWLHGEHAVWHDYHHSANTGNFGSEMMDTLFSSDDAFRKDFPKGVMSAAPEAVRGKKLD